jgi:hypothetical protein
VAEKNPVRGMQPMDEYEEMMYRRSPEGKAEMQRGAMKAIGAPAAIIVGGSMAAGAAGEYAKRKRDREESEAKSELKRETRGMKKGGTVKSASSRADGIAQRGKTRGRMV